jgi:hypothetical protein
MRLSACAWPPTVCSWSVTYKILPCSGISCAWREYGAPWRSRVPTLESLRAGGLLLARW